MRGGNAVWPKEQGWRSFVFSALLNCFQWSAHEAEDPRMVDCTQQRNQEGWQNAKRLTRSAEHTHGKQKGADTDGYEA